MSVFVVGAGLAGCEAAWQLGNAGFDVDLYEMKPNRYSPAHKYEGLCELVCSNSLKALGTASASGMLKREMRFLGSLVIASAMKAQVPAGGALAVDRKAFSDNITEEIKNHPKIHLIRKEITEIPEGYGIIATGPLTSDIFAKKIQEKVGEDYLSFYDAAAPIVTAESLEQDKVFLAARYGRGTADYINCPMNKDEYDRFYNELIGARKAELHSFDKGGPNVYEGCMPIEELAKRGKDAMRFGPLRPVGLWHPETGEKYYAVLQLRKENTQASLYNLVGFQTNLKFSEQKRVFGLIPGLANADYMRYGVMHRNLFLNSPKLLDSSLRLKEDVRIRFAGQMTGVEGYVESAASGIFAGQSLAKELLKKEIFSLPRTTMLGALIGYVTSQSTENFQPMGANMGLLPPLEEPIRKKQERYSALSDRGYAFLVKEEAVV